MDAPLTFQVTPVILESDLRHLATRERKCLFPDEVNQLPSDLSLAKLDVGAPVRPQRRQFLKQYSQSGCLFECMMEGSKTSEKQCSPWMLPQSGNERECH